jgi:hypothetical protein
MNKEQTPIALFVYARPEHTRRTIDSIKANPHWDRHPITVYADGPASKSDAANVEAVRRLVEDAFAGTANIITHESNKGLAASLIKGISQQTDQYGRVIVLEDDLVLSPVALAYFTQMLERYENDERIMHIAGFSAPTPQPLPELFLYRECSCWGWATWQRAWKHFNPDAAALLRHINRSGRKLAFDINAQAAYNDMLWQCAYRGLDSWAIRWYASVFVQHGLALHPGKSFVQNIGMDGSGVHCVPTNNFDVALSTTLPRIPEILDEESMDALASMAGFYKQIRFSGTSVIRRRLRYWTHFFRSYIPTR